MKILFYNHTNRVSGAERVLLNLLAHLDRERFAPVALCPANEDGAELRSMIEERGVECDTSKSIDARFTSRFTDAARALLSIARCAIDVRRRVRGTKPDLIHANSIRAGLVATLATTGMRVPVVWHLHDLLPAHAFSRFVRLVASRSSRTRLLAISEAVRDSFVADDESLAARSRVILNAIDVERFAREAGSPEAMRRELGLANAYPVAGVVGHLAECKNQLGVLDAFANVLAREPRARLVVVGAELFKSGAQSYETRLRERAAQPDLKGRVIFLGNRSDVPVVMSALDLLVVNSEAEPFGLVMLEAMACGTPVIATAAGGVPEIITHNETGWLVPVGDAEALASAIVELSHDADLRRAISIAARLHVEEKFDVNNYMNALESCYEEAAADGNVPHEPARTRVALTPDVYGEGAAGAARRQINL